MSLHIIRLRHKKKTAAHLYKHMNFYSTIIKIGFAMKIYKKNLIKSINSKENSKILSQRMININYKKIININHTLVNKILKILINTQNLNKNCLQINNLKYFKLD